MKSCVLILIAGDSTRFQLFVAANIVLGESALHKDAHAEEHDADPHQKCGSKKNLHIYLISNSVLTGSYI